MRVIFMGTPDYAEQILERLIQTKEIEVVAVYTQPDKPVGRKKVLTPPPVKKLAQEFGIEVYQPQKLRDEEVIQELVQLSCDYIVVAAYGQILPKEILEHAPCINLHASILPQYRGASPIQQTLLNGDKKTGVTAMLMEEGLDTGDILAVKSIDVADTMMVEELFDTLTELAAELTLEVLKNFNEYTPEVQNDAEASLCKKITKADGLIDLDDAQLIYNKYRAFTPWPGIYLESGLKLKHITLEETESQNQSAKILSISKESIVVACKKGSLRIFRVQSQSKKEMEIGAYINGKRLQCEDYLS